MLRSSAVGTDKNNEISKKMNACFSFILVLNPSLPNVSLLGDHADSSANN